MSHSSQPLPIFDVGKVLSDAFTVYRGAFSKIFTIYLIVGLISFAIAYAVGSSVGGIVNISDMTFGGAVITLLYAVLNNVALGAAILIAYDWGHGRPISVQAALSAALSKVHYLIIMTFIWGFAVSLATMALVVPGIWLIGVWAVILPCIIIEGHGFNAFGRSAELTKFYRWPVVGALVVILLLVGVLSFVTSAIATAIAVGSIIPAVIQTFVGAAINGLFVAIMVSVYQRLIDLKEGGTDTGVADVFE